MQKRITRLWTLLLALALVCTSLFPGVALADETYLFSAPGDWFATVTVTNGQATVTFNRAESHPADATIRQALAALTNPSLGEIAAAMLQGGFLPYTPPPFIAESALQQMKPDCGAGVVAETLGFNPAMSPAQVEVGFSGVVNSAGVNGFINTRQIASLKRYAATLAKGECTQPSAEDLANMAAARAGLLNIASQMDFQIVSGSSGADVRPVPGERPIPVPAP